MKLADVVQPDDFSNKESTVKDLYNTVGSRTHEFVIFFDWLKKKYPGLNFYTIPDLNKKQRATIGQRNSEKLVNTYNRMQAAGHAFLKAGGRYQDFQDFQNAQLPPGWTPEDDK